MDTLLAFTPLLPAPVLWGLVVAAALAVGIARWRQLPGWWLRGLALAILIAALVDPALRQEDREPRDDIVFLVLDRTESQTIAGRDEQLSAAADAVLRDLASFEGFDVVEIDVENDPENDESGSMVLEALATAAAARPRDQISGAIIVSDGQIHDRIAVRRQGDDGGEDDGAGFRPLERFPGPVHLLLTGRSDEWDRRLEVRSAPAFAIVDEPFRLAFRIDDLGAIPSDVSDTTRVVVSVNGETVAIARAEVGDEVEFPLTLPRGGLNLLQVTAETEPGELTGRNNAAVLRVNGVRDRLRVLLVSGLPYAGERTWRNLLKSDSAVDLVHFTILRPPSKTDGTPVQELALIEFPTRDLFLNKIDEFDLIIFDRYEVRGILHGVYLANVVEYLRRGGALLVTSGPSMAGPRSLYRTALSEVLPARPTAAVIERPFWPEVTGQGHRHPVTEGLAGSEPASDDGTVETTERWGQWHRLVEAVQESGQAVMAGPDGRPLLVLDRVGDGRIAMLLSDQAWLWTRGHDGGGPQLELLRRLAHWMMKEPDLEEERLTAATVGDRILATRRSMTDQVPDLRVARPDGQLVDIEMQPTGPGRWFAEFEANDSGVYRLSDRTMTQVAVMGSSAPREFERPLATSERLMPLVSATGGGLVRLETDGIPDVRLIRPGRVADGRGWIGLAPREAYLTVDVRRFPLVPAWLLLILSMALCVTAWRLEGR
ncbi:MAG: hypothetical protein OXI81_07025 [Paracoccaceae bacterium]|nr:hypothetical protein [Paracoccaceae bacterium]MDE2913674.1 hypothetical protein [Paracoccaceae bacterium]